MTAATIARTLSKPLTPAMIGAGESEGRGAAGAAEAAGRDAMGAGPEVRGAAAATGAAAADGGGAGAAPEGPPGGSVGSLIVGAAEGLGGKLIRTVSFLGWTLPVSFFGGTAPVGMLGIFSAIRNVNFVLS